MMCENERKNNPKLCDRIKPWAEIVQSFFVVAAIVAAGIWFFWQGETSPKAKISHMVTHRQINENLTWVHVSITITNAGKTTLDLASGVIRIQKILPLDPKISERIERNENPIPQDSLIVAWPRIGDSYEPPLNIKIEPGESDMLKSEFIIPSYVKTVKIYSYFEKQKDSPTGWSTTTIYDLKRKKDETNA